MSFVQSPWIKRLVHPSGTESPPGADGSS
jgi:hypothetical protein